MIEHHKNDSDLYTPILNKFETISKESVEKTQKSEKTIIREKMSDVEAKLKELNLNITGLNTSCEQLKENKVEEHLKSLNENVTKEVSMKVEKGKFETKLLELHNKIENIADLTKNHKEVTEHLSKITSSLNTLKDDITSINIDNKVNRLESSIATNISKQLKQLAKETQFSIDSKINSLLTELDEEKETKRRIRSINANSVDIPSTEFNFKDFTETDRIAPNDSITYLTLKKESKDWAGFKLGIPVKEGSIKYSIKFERVYDNNIFIGFTLSDYEGLTYNEKINSAVMFNLNNGQLATEKDGKINIKKIKSNDYCTVLLDFSEKKITLFLNGVESSKKDLKLQGEFQPCIDLRNEAEFTIMNI
jgi:hypothetical protein